MICVQDAFCYTYSGVVRKEEGKSLARCMSRIFFGELNVGDGAKSVECESFCFVFSTTRRLAYVRHDSSIIQTWQCRAEDNVSLPPRP